MLLDDYERERRITYRLRVLPQQLLRARRRYRDLVAEAQELRMFDLLEPDEMECANDT